MLLALGALAVLPGSSAATRGRAGAAKASPEVARASDAPGESARVVPVVTSHAALVPAPLFFAETIETYDAGCATPKNSFNLGETVCVKLTDAPEFGAAVVFSDPDNFTRNVPFPVSPTAASYSFVLPSTSTTGGVDNRGTWAAAVVNTEDNSRRNVASFLVHDPNQSVADVTISKTLLDTTQVTAGNNTNYRVYVTNQGPDAASSVAFTDNTLPNTTFISFTQDSGPAFTCTPPAVGVAGSTECTLASMAVGDIAVFTAVYKLNTGVSNGAPLEDTIEIESATFDSHESSNSSTVDSEASNPTPPPCSLACPANISVGNDAGQSGAVVPFGAPTATGTCGSLTSVPASGSFFQIGSSVVTFTEAGGQSCSFAVTVTDEEDPTISCPPNMTVDEKPAGSGSANVNFNVTATDNGGAATVSCNPASGSSFNVGTTSVTCIATDQSGNTSECNFDVTVKEATCSFEQPLDIVEDADVDATGSQSCGANVTFATPTATCPEEITSTVTCDHASGSFFPLGDTVVTCKSNPDGATTSFTVTVKDITAPAPDLSSLPTITGECSATAGVPTTLIIRDALGNPIGTKIVNEPPTATDNCNSKTSGSTNDQRTYDEPGTYTVHWTYTDASGNTSTQNQTVIVTGPTGGLSITGPPVVVVQIPLGSSSCSIEIDDVGALMNTTVGGVCGGFDISHSVSPAAPGNVYNVGATYTVISTVTDGANTASVTQQLKIVDNTPPTITAPANVTVNADPVSCSVPAASVSLGTPVAGAHCGVPTVTNNAPSSFPLGQTTVTWTVTDTSGHTATATQTVTVVDVTPPVITLNGSNPTYVLLHSAYVEPGATATDNCSTSFAATPSGTVNVDTIGTYVITYNATDPSGNAATAVTRTVKVIYDFSGFFQPVDNPLIINEVKAGLGVPVKFSLAGNQGLGIFAAGYPTSIAIDCNSGTSIVPLEETVTAGSSSLSYDASSDRYIYVWKTQSEWKSTCRRLDVTLIDGTTHSALFKFK
ncbi:MAG TPA: PxKF domain-containing protein [Pyrinomonadaceae bacterium]|nr:PxKF domain-containing protein [Pyrinomonadaceae bacterium]